MEKKIALCADSECLRNPSVLGIKGEQILDQGWIVAFADALIARKYLRENKVDETWVVSSDSIDGINLAAALKKDNNQANVRFFLPSPSGSKMSRCKNAGILPICGKGEFAHLYAAQKRIYMPSAMPKHVSELTDAALAPALASFDDPKPTPVPLPTPEPMPSAASLAEAAQPKNSQVTVQRINRRKPSSRSALPQIQIEDIPATALEGDHETLKLPKRISFDTPKANFSSGSSGGSVLATKAPVLPATDEGASVVSIVSGSGGTGKSSISALVALLSQNRGYKTLLLDADFQFGDLQYLLGYKQPLDATDILMRPEQIDTLLKVDTWPALLSAPSQLEHSELMQEKIGELLKYLKPHFDLIVINTGAFWSELQVQLLEASTQVYFLLDQRPSSIRACNHALDLCARCGIATTAFSYLLNFCSKKSLLSALDVSCALKGAKVHEIKDGGPEVGELLGAGMAHKLAKINNPFCASVNTLLQETIYERVKPSLEQPREFIVDKNTTANVRSKFLARQRRRAACF